MGLSVSRYRRSKQIVNQNIPAIYYAPKTSEEQKSLTIDTKIMSIDAIKEHYEKLDAQNVDGIGWVSKSGVHFLCAEGTEDVYKKSGFEGSLSELLDRQQFEEMNWRIITDAGHIDFQVNGMLVIGEQKFRIMDVVYAFSTGTSPNRYKFYQRGKLTMKEYRQLSPKLIILR